MKKVDQERIERVARLYASNEDASRALGIAPGSFSRLCRLYEIETPYARKRRRWREARQQDKQTDIFAFDLDGELEVDTAEIMAIEEKLEQRRAS